ncbi:MAG: hypothetical protein AAFR81_27530 [Chloroflexota bacterium]
MNVDNRRRVWVITGIAGLAGMIFNLLQVIIILAGGYNRNPNISPPWLQTLDAIGLTLVWLGVSGVVFAVSWRRLTRPEE